MAVFVESPAPVEGLEALKRRAGAVLAPRAQTPVAVSYGSSAGELSVLVRRVGIADSSHLAKLELFAGAQELQAVVGELSGGIVMPGGARWAGGVWWCVAGSERVLALAESPAASRLRERLRTLGTRRPALRVLDRSQEWAAIGLIGRHCGLMLDALGVYGEAGDPRLARPVTVGAIGEVPATWLLQSDRRALALVARSDAARAWRTLERLGRPVGLACVGQDAVARYALLERRGSV